MLSARWMRPRFIAGSTPKEWRTTVSCRRAASNTAFTPAEQALIERAEQQELQKKLLQQAALSPSAAGAKQNCRNLQQDKHSYLKRRIDEQYLNSRSACDLSHVGVAADPQREACYQAAKEQMQQKLTALPSVQLCRD